MFYPGLAAIMCAVLRHETDVHNGNRHLAEDWQHRGGTTVTVTGTGFLPIAGADMAEVGTTMVAANCTSTTKCTIVTPKHAAATVNIRMSAEDFALSPVTTKDKYTYKSCARVAYHCGARLR